MSLKLKLFRSIGIFVLIFFQCGQVQASGLKEKLATRMLSLIKSAKLPDLSVSVIDLSNGEDLFDYHGELLLKPASVLKLLTSAAALEKLGPEFRFRTDIFSEGALRDGQLEAIYVKGGGDPDLTIESSFNMVRALKLLGITRVKKLYLDDSYFLSKQERSGQRAYQSGSSALSFNFNSITFQICAGRVGEAASVRADPIELSPIYEGRILTSSAAQSSFSVDEIESKDMSLRYRLSGTFAAAQGCVKIYRSVSNPSQYFGQTFLRLLEEVGISVAEALSYAKVPVSAHLLHTNFSKPLSELLRDLNHFSNNFIAEQILFMLDTERVDALDRGRGLLTLRGYLENLGFKSQNIALFDASGLSHQNRLSARSVTTLLQHIYIQQGLRTEFENSLSVANRSGTLKNRAFNLSGSILRGKTGSLDGVSSLAGYIFSPRNKAVAFAILINGAASKDRAISLERDLVEALASLI